MTYPLEGTGVWSAALRYGDAAEAADAAGELEALGYTALWLPDVGGDLFSAVANLLSATTVATIATGILNTWLHSPEETAAHHAELTAQHGRRFLVGLGVSHQRLIDHVKDRGTYHRPLAHMQGYLDGLDDARPPLDARDRVLAALGPKMLELARTRAAGSHPYLVAPEHTAATREALGAGPVVAVEQGVVLDSDPDAARAAARGHLATYLDLPNYSSNWKRLGFTDDDLADGGSDRLVDALYAWGTESAIAQRVQDHQDAGASHVCVQVVGGDSRSFPMAQWRTLAPALV